MTDVRLTELLTGSLPEDFVPPRGSQLTLDSFRAIGDSVWELSVVRVPGTESGGVVLGADNAGHIGVGWEVDGLNRRGWPVRYRMFIVPELSPLGLCARMEVDGRAIDEFTDPKTGRNMGPVQPVSYWYEWILTQDARGRIAKGAGFEADDSRVLPLEGTPSDPQATDRPAYPWADGAGSRGLDEPRTSDSIAPLFTEAMNDAVAFHTCFTGDFDDIAAFQRWLSAELAGSFLKARVYRLRPFEREDPPDELSKYLKTLRDYCRDPEEGEVADSAPFPFHTGLDPERWYRRLRGLDVEAIVATIVMHDQRAAEYWTTMTARRRAWRRYLTEEPFTPEEATLGDEAAWWAVSIVGTEILLVFPSRHSRFKVAVDTRGGEHITFAVTSEQAMWERLGRTERYLQRWETWLDESRELPETLARMGVERAERELRDLIRRQCEEGWE